MAAASTQIGTEKVFGFVLPVGTSGELAKQTVIAILTAVFLLVVFISFVFPRFSELAAEAKIVRDLETKSNNLTKTLDALDDFKQNVSDAAKESVYLAIPTKFDPGYILLSLRKLSAENQVNLTTYNLTGGELKETTAKAVITNAVSHEVRLEISGLALNLINFVDSLDHYLPIASIADLSISEVSKVLLSSGNDSKLSMSLNFYHMPLASVPAESLMGKILTAKNIEDINSLATYKRLGVFTTGSGIPAGSGKENIFGF